MWRGIGWRDVCVCAFVEGDRLEMGVCVWRGIGWRGVCVCVFGGGIGWRGVCECVCGGGMRDTGQGVEVAMFWMLWSL